MKRNQSGFTLIEIAIVLVIIGLLLGGVMKGQELINSAKVKNFATDFKNIPVYIYGYQDKFRALPGDDPQAVAHLGSGATQATSAVSPGNGIISGAWDSTVTTDESQLFWQHVRLAGLAPGLTTGTDYLPTNSAGGIIGITSGSNTPISGLNGSYVVCSQGILGKFVKQLDIQMDDGATDTGSLRAMSIPTSRGGTTAASAVNVATATNGDSTTYVVCMGI